MLRVLPMQPRENLSICRVQVVPVFLSYFKTLRPSSIKRSTDSELVLSRYQGLDPPQGPLTTQWITCDSALFSFRLVKNVLAGLNVACERIRVFGRRLTFRVDRSEHRKFVCVRRLALNSATSKNECMRAANVGPDLRLDLRLLSES